LQTGRRPPSQATLEMAVRAILAKPSNPFRSYNVAARNAFEARIPLELRPDVW